LLAAGLALLVTGIVMLTRPQQIVASDFYLTDANTQYPNITGTRLDTCLLCHTISVPTTDTTRNLYGQAFQRNGHSFTAIESLNSDGTGGTNIQEILALTFPGDPNDPPLPTATNTNTPVPSPTATNTPVGVTPTATSTATNTPVGVTPTATSTATNTPVGVTPTATSTATKTPVGVTPTATATSTKTVTPSATGTLRYIWLPLVLALSSQP